MDETTLEPVAGAPAPPTPPSRFKMLKPLSLRDFRLLWLGMTVSLIGDGIYLVAIPWQIYEGLDASPAAFSLVGAAWTIPQVILLLFGGVLTDRVDRRFILIGSDLLRGASILIVGLLSLAGTLELWHLVVLVAIYGAGEAFFMPAFSAVVPDVVPQDQLLEANSLDQFVRPFALRMAGPALGAAIIASPLDIGGAFIVDSVTFALSALAVAFMKKLPKVRPETAVSSTWSEIVEGFRFVRSRSWLWSGLLATATGLLFFFGPWQVLVPFLIEGELEGRVGDFGLVIIAAGVGAIGVSFLIGQRTSPERPVLYVLIAWALAHLMLIGFGVAEMLWQAMLAAIVMSALLTAGQIVWATTEHQLVPRSILGRVSSFDWLMSTVMLPVSMGLAGPVANAIGARSTLVLAGIIGSACLFAFIAVPGVTQPRSALEPTK